MKIKKNTSTLLIMIMIFLMFKLVSFCQSNFEKQTSQELTITVNTDKPYYQPLELVKIFGTVKNQTNTPISDAYVGIQVEDPNNNTIFLDIVYTSSNGSYEDHFRLQATTILGKYNVYVTASAEGYSTIANKTIFYVESQENQTYQLTITSSTGGTTDPEPGTYNYPAGTIIQVTAIPDLGFSFMEWFFDDQIITENPIIITMDANHTVEAHFSDNISPGISDPIQDPPSAEIQPFHNVTIYINAIDHGTGIKNITLWFSTDNGTNWTLKEMEQNGELYQATIPGYGNCTWVTYKIIAYDNAENIAIKDNNGYNYQYHVIPEFPSTALSLAILTITTLIATTILRTKRKQHFT